METPLASLSVGMWGASRGAELSLLVLPASFVLLAGCSGGGGAGARGKSAALLYKQLGAKSPFSSGFYTDGGYTVAFEVPLDCIVGLDYSNPLVQVSQPHRLAGGATKNHVGGLLGLPRRPCRSGESRAGQRCSSRGG